MSETHQNIDQANITPALDILLMDYAAGALDEALGLFLDSYLYRSQSARQRLKAYTELGGALLCGQCAPAAMHENSLHRVLEQLDVRPTATHSETQRRTTPENSAATHRSLKDERIEQLPAPLRSAIAAHNKNTRWMPFLPGMSFIEVKPQNAQCRSRVRIIHMRPGARTPPHIHQGLELTYVIDGAFSDDGVYYDTGSLVIHEAADNHTYHSDNSSHPRPDHSSHHHDKSNHAHAPVACAERGCLCITATDAPIRFTKGWARLFNPLIK